MKTNKTIGRISVGAAMVAFSIGLFGSFDLKADDTGGGGGCPADTVSKPAKKGKDSQGNIYYSCPVTQDADAECCVSK